MDSTEVRRMWADRSGEFSPTYYAHHGPNDASETVCARLSRHLDRDASVLELGCSSGRHLAHLREQGFEDLSGVEVNEEAFDVMAETYPDLFESGTFYAAAIEDVVRDFGDGQFDAVFSVETLQHIHPDATWVFDEVARITGDVLVTIEHEGDGGQGGEVNYVTDDVPLYYRDWETIFTDLGLEQVDVVAGERDTVRTFRVS